MNMKRFFAIAATALINASLIGTMNVYANNVSIDTAKEHLTAVWTEYAEAMNEFYDSEEWAYSYIREFLEENSWDALIRARIACRLAAFNIRDLELTNSLSDEECTLLAKNNIDYQALLVETENFETTRDEGSELLSDALFIKLVEDVWYQDYLDVLDEKITLNEEELKIDRQYLDAEMQYCLVITDDPNRPQKSAEELEKEANSLLDEFDAISSKLKNIKAKENAISDLVLEKLMDDDSDSIQWFLENASTIENIPELLPFPAWYFKEDYKYAFFVLKDDATINFLEYGDDLEEEMAKGKYAIYMQGNPIDADEIDEYITLIDDMVQASTREDDTWLIVKDTYSMRINLTEDTLSITVAGADIPFSTLPQPTAAETNKINQDVTLLPERDEINTINETLIAGNWHTVGLKRNGTVMAIGYNGNGQCNVSDWTNIVAVSGGGYHTVGLKSDGKVVAVGDNTYNQCDVNSWTDVVAISTDCYYTAGLKSDGTVVAVGIGPCNLSSWHDIVAISVEDSFIVGLKNDGTVVAMGDNTIGQCNVNDWTDIVAISAGTYNTVGLKADGTLVATGDTSDGECDVDEWTDIVAVSVGLAYTVGLKADGTVVATGKNNYGQCNVSDWTDIVAISAGEYHTVGLKSDGTAVATGRNEDKQCDLENWSDIRLPSESAPSDVSAISENTIVTTPIQQTIDGELCETIVLKDDGKIDALGPTFIGIRDARRWNDIIAVSAGLFHLVGLKQDGTVVAAGENSDGQCNVEDWTDIVSISASYCYTLGLKSNGTVVATGNNDNGQCDVEDWTDIIVISAGDNFALGLKKDGTVVAAGNNDTVQDSVSSWEDIVGISAGAYHAVGLKKGGTVVAAGYNSSGQCDVDDWTDIISISAGSEHTVGLKSDGTVVSTSVAAGDTRNYGQCNVTNWKNIVEISTGDYHTIGLRADGTVVAVGRNAENQCNVENWKNIKLPTN